MIKGKIVAGISAAILAACGVAACGSSGSGSSDSGVKTITVTATDTQPTNIGSEGPNIIWSYHPVAKCPAGYVAVGGGLKDSTVNLPFPLGVDGPTPDGLGWQGHERTSLSNGALDVGVTVICALGTTS
jgi:hypothetical protein